MLSKRVGVLAFSILAVATGTSACSSSVDGTAASAASTSCGFVGLVPKAPKAAGARATIQAQAEAQGLIALDGYLGPYLRGHTAVYRGTITAHDNQGVLRNQFGGPKLENQTVPSSAAVASLDVRKGNAVLTVHAVPEHKYLVIQQATADKTQTTTVGIILSDTTGGGNSGACVRCIPALGGQPASIDFQSVEATQLVALTGGGKATLHTYATASLEYVPPCGVTFDDIAELNEPSSLRFVAGSKADEVVSKMTGYGYTQNGCYGSYTIELYVNTANLSDYGVRNFVEMPSPYCGG